MKGKEASRGKSWETTAKKSLSVHRIYPRYHKKNLRGNRYFGGAMEGESGGYLSASELNNGSIRYCIRWNKLWRGALSRRASSLFHQIGLDAKVPNLELAFPRDGIKSSN